MTKLERHRFFLYGRAAVSLLLYLASIILGASTIVTASTGGAMAWVVGGMLIGSIVVLPRTAVPQNEEARQEATDEEIDRYRRIRSWLTWTRLAYLAVALVVFVGLPELL